jgi:uncharacterized protein YceH (UPF0502 family)
LLWGRYTLCVPDVGIILLFLAGARVGKLLKTRTKRIIAFAARKTAFMQIYCMILKKNCRKSTGARACIVDFSREIKCSES